MVMVGTRNNELGRYFKGDIGELIVYPRALNATEQASVAAYLAHQWPQTQARTGAPVECGSSSGGQDRRESGFDLISSLFLVVPCRII